jgi:hypothetical protein
MNKRKLLVGYLLTSLSFLVLILPTIALFIVNYDIWVSVSSETTKISLGVMLGMLYAIFVMNGALKEISPKIATLISMIVFLMIIWFLESVIQDLFWVVLSVIVGYVLYIGVSSIGLRQINEYKTYKDEKIRMAVRKQAQEDIMGV